MENKLTPKEEIEQLIRDRAFELTRSGEHERAASLIIEYNRSQLTDSHPSKSVELMGSLEGSKVSEFAKFEEDSQQTKERLAFMSAVFQGGNNPVAIMTTAGILVEYLVMEHSYMLPAATKYLVNKKNDKGMTSHEEDENWKFLDKPKED